MSLLANVLEERTRVGELYENIGDQRIRCFACGHQCPIPDGAAGVCKVRFNRGGKLMVPYGYVAGAQCDPVEKKPYYHVRPGALAFSFGMLGCDFHCSYCQNWLSSQALRDPHAGSPIRDTSAEQLVRTARKQGAELVVSTYNEPLITSEWAVAVFEEARKAGLLTGFVSNGNGTPRVLEYLKPWTDIYKVDLKGFSDARYRRLGGRLEPVLATIRCLWEMGFWVEIVTLLVPEFNDSDEEIGKMTEFIAGVSPDIPWHVTAFHPDYKMTEPDYTEAKDLIRAAELGRRAGLRFVYAGNLPGRLGHLENTYCPKCRQLLVERRGFRVLSYSLTDRGCCPACMTEIPGRWAAAFRTQTGNAPTLQ